MSTGKEILNSETKNHCAEIREMPGVTRILIVDDSPQVRLGLATMLKLAMKNLQHNVEVIGEAQNGDEAIELARLLRPDVVLMDLEMPVLDGFGATRAIKSMNPSIAVIALTIHGDPVSRTNAEQAGADAFIEKDAQINELLQAIQRYGMPA